VIFGGFEGFLVDFGRKMSENGRKMSVFGGVFWQSLEKN
jgi:hypothetical protein